MKSASRRMSVFAFIKLKGFVRVFCRGRLFNYRLYQRIDLSADGGVHGVPFHRKSYERTSVEGLFARLQESDNTKTCSIDSRIVTPQRLDHRRHKGMSGRFLD
ncbi:hypothetical protein CEXT_372641 [Caerostris extrusa]|uniref:Uncharacterized protein n=1 Tax=Caerostris extrusa TaxID=172846 RepID=A0AAV4TRE2_CAEEX|nr:hypothetical protein CEXT_372641 [Caerostris extrusa]